MIYWRTILPRMTHLQASSNNYLIIIINQHIFKINSNIIWSLWFIQSEIFTLKFSCSLQGSINFLIHSSKFLVLRCHLLFESPYQTSCNGMELAKFLFVQFFLTFHQSHLSCQFGIQIRGHILCHILEKGLGWLKNKC